MPPFQFDSNVLSPRYRKHWRDRGTYHHNTSELNLWNSQNTNPLSSPHFPCVSREIREQWLVNLTGEYIPDDVLDIACLGKKFGVPITREKDIPVNKIIATIESSMSLIEKEHQNAARSVLVDVISGFLREEREPEHPELIEKIQSAREFKNSHPDVLFLKADKGNVTVAVTRELYLSKMSDLLNDRSTYKIMKDDPTPDIQTKVNKLLMKWYRRDFITDYEKSRLWSRNGNIALSYGLPKIHKPNVPFRMIVSFVGTPTYQLAQYVQRILTDCMKEEIKYFTTNKTAITNSIALVKKIRSLDLPEDFVMISMDVVSLFTNVPIQLVIAGVRKRWGMIKKYTKISQDLFIEAVSLCFNASAFQFNKIKYQQVFGAAMGSPLSPIVAEIVLQDLENFCMNRLDFPVYFYTRYVDDVLAFVPKDKIESILSCFNSYHKSLQFTLEKEENRRINFLEVTLIREKRRIGIDWYRKPTSSGRYLNYYSHHPMRHKTTMIYNLIDRCILLSDSQYHLKNLAFVRQSLLGNGYPKRMVVKILYRRQAFLLCPNNYHSNDFHKLRKMDPSRRVTLPYVQHLSEALQSNLRKFNISLSFRNDSNLRWLFAGNKDKLPRDKQVNTVYKISCLECRFTFIEHTKKPLGAIIKGHHQSLRQPHISPVSNRLTEHAFRYVHDFNFDRVQVLAVEANYKIRELLSLIFKEVEFPEADESVDRISDVSKIYSSLFH